MAVTTQIESRGAPVIGPLLERYYGPAVSTLSVLAFLVLWQVAGAWGWRPGAVNSRRARVRSRGARGRSIGLPARRSAATARRRDDGQERQRPV